MSFELHGFKFSEEASTDLSAAQFLAVINSATGVALPGGAGVPILGILNNDPEALGVAGEIVNGGISKWTASAAIAVNASVTTATGGKAVTAGTGNIVHGIAMEASAADGDIIAVLLNTNGRIST